MLSSNAGARLSASPPSQNTYPSANPADDVLYGAGAIAIFLYGNERYRRRVYHMAATNRLPVMRLPGLSARKSTLLCWLHQQEQRSGVTASSVEAAA